MFYQLPSPMIQLSPYYSLQYNWFRDFFGIYPFGRGIYPKIVGRYLDIRLCSIPTVGVYEKQGKLHLTRSTSYLLYYSSPKRAPSPLLLLRCFRPPPLPPAANGACHPLLSSSPPPPPPLTRSAAVRRCGRQNKLPSQRQTTR